MKNINIEGISEEQLVAILEILGQTNSAKQPATCHSKAIKNTNDINSQEVEESSTEGHTEGENNENNTNEYIPSERELAFDYIQEHFDCFMGTDNTVYWSRKGTGIATDDITEMKEEVINFSSRTHAIKELQADNAFNMVKFFLREDLASNKAKKVDLAPRLATHGNDVWIDTANNKTGFVKITPEGEWSLESTVPSRSVL